MSWEGSDSRHVCWARPSLPSFFREPAPGPVPSAHAMLCPGCCALACGPCLRKGGWRETFYPAGPIWCPGVAWSRPSCPHPPRTFGLAGVVCLHEVPGAAAEMAALGVVAELGAGAKAQALIDVWGLHRRVIGVRQLVFLLSSLRRSHFPTLASGLPWHGVEARATGTVSSFLGSHTACLIPTDAGVGGAAGQLGVCGGQRVDFLP